MLLAKKYFLSFLIVASLGVLQFNIVSGIKLAYADESLLKTQGLLTESTSGNYGSSPQDVKVIVLNLIKTALTFIAIIMVVLLIIDGFKYMTSAGNETKIKETLGQIQALAIGLVIIMTSWGITYYLLRVAVCNTVSTGTSCTPW